MAVTFQPPPTYADVVVFDPTGEHPKFNPIWLKWFLDLVQVINDSGGGGGIISHNSTSGLQGGTANQYYHLQASEYTGSGTGTFARVNGPTFTAPVLGTPASGVLTNCTGTASGLTAGNVTTNANLTGPITSVGNATSVASQTGTGSKFVMDTSPTLVTPNIGVASGTSLGLSGAITTAGGATFHTTSTALTNGAGGSTGTLTTAPSAGNPTKWIGINDNGTTRYIPAW